MVETTMVDITRVFVFHGLAQPAPHLVTFLPSTHDRPSLNVASQSASYTDPVDGFNFDKPQYEYFSPLRVRPNAQRKVRTLYYS